MPIIDAYHDTKKQAVMADTWGHMFPEPGKKYFGKMGIAIGEYGDEIIVKSDFQGLECSPQRHELEHTVFERLVLEPGVYLVRCGLRFHKDCNRCFMGGAIGKIINIQVEAIEA